jgi:hypothetical protein
MEVLERGVVTVEASQLVRRAELGEMAAVLQAGTESGWPSMLMVAGLVSMRSPARTVPVPDKSRPPAQHRRRRSPRRKHAVTAARSCLHGAQDGTPDVLRHSTAMSLQVSEPPTDDRRPPPLRRIPRPGPAGPPPTRHRASRPGSSQRNRRQGHRRLTEEALPTASGDCEDTHRQTI